MTLELTPHTQLMKMLDNDNSLDVSFTEFMKVEKKASTVLAPAFRLQRQLQEKCMGARYWKKNRKRVLKMLKVSEAGRGGGGGVEDEKYVRATTKPNQTNSFSHLLRSAQEDKCDTLIDYFANRVEKDMPPPLTVDDDDPDLKDSDEESSDEDEQTWEQIEAERLREEEEGRINEFMQVSERSGGGGCGRRKYEPTTKLT